MKLDTLANALARMRSGVILRCFWRNNSGTGKNSENSDGTLPTAQRLTNNDTSLEAQKKKG